MGKLCMERESSGSSTFGGAVYARTFDNLSHVLSSTEEELEFLKIEGLVVTQLWNHFVPQL